MVTSVDNEDARTKLLGSRSFLQPDVPFLLGKYPDRVGPVHVVNGLLVALCGQGPAAAEFREFVRGDGRSIGDVSAQIVGDDRKRRALKDSLRTILDPDHRIFPTRGSPFPLNLGLIAK